MKKNGSLHYYMVAGQVIIQDGEDSIISVPANGVLTTDNYNHKINAHALGKAQQALQVFAANKLGEMPQVIDVLITGIMDLGNMTPAEFDAKPEGMIVQDRPVQADPADPFAAQIADRVMVD